MALPYNTYGVIRSGYRYSLSARSSDRPLHP